MLWLLSTMVVPVGAGGRRTLWEEFCVVLVVRVAVDVVMWFWLQSLAVRDLYYCHSLVLVDLCIIE
jgi:hypothetical protein